MTSTRPTYGYHSSGFQRSMSDDEIRRVAPAVFATSKAEETSDKYQFVSTEKFHNIIKSHGYAPVDVQSKRGKDALHADHQIIYQRVDDQSRLVNVGDELFQMRMRNSHNGKTAKQLIAGIFRKICANGMTVCIGEDGRIKIVHMGSDIEERINIGLERITMFAPLALEVAREMKLIQVDLDVARVLAEEAIVERWAKPGRDLLLPDGTYIEYEARQLDDALDVTESMDDEDDEDEAPSLGPVLVPVTIDQMIKSRRQADKWTEGNDPRNNLYTVHNIIQENVLEGGMYGASFDAKGNRKRKDVKVRRVSGIEQNDRINTQLWKLSMATMAMLKKPVV